METVLKHMDVIANDEFQHLVEDREGHVVSIYIPTHRAGAEIEQDPIRFKNQLQKVEAILEARGLDPQQIGELLSPATLLLNDENRDFWRYQSDGLAVFLGPDESYTYRLPINFEERAVVNSRFYLKPLIDYVQSHGHCYAVSLQAGGVKLYKVTPYKMGLMDLPSDVPTSIEDYLGPETFQDYLRSYTSGNPNAAGQTATSYGTRAGYSDQAEMKSKIQQFFHRVEDAITDIVNGTEAPLVMVGLDPLLAMYREANHYSKLLPEAVDAHPDDLSETELHDKVWRLVKPHFEATQQEHHDLFKQLEGQGDERAASDLENVVSAAYFQRVDTLFLRKGAVQWGQFDPEGNTLTLHDEQQPGDEDMLYYAAIHTMKNGGSVYVIDAMPVADADAAAILRY